MRRTSQWPSLHEVASRGREISRSRIVGPERQWQPTSPQVEVPMNLIEFIIETADLYGNCTIVDIRRNEFRLITWVNYKRQSVFVRAFLTHADYDREGWKDDC